MSCARSAVASRTTAVPGSRDRTSLARILTPYESPVAPARSRSARASSSSRPMWASSGSEGGTPTTTSAVSAAPSSAANLHAISNASSDCGRASSSTRTRRYPCTTGRRRREYTEQTLGTRASRPAQDHPQSDRSGRRSRRDRRAGSRRRLVEDVAGPRRLGLDLPSELRDVDVQVVRLLAVRRAPDLAQDRRVRQQLALVPGEQAQQVVLGRRQRDPRPATVTRALLEVDRELADRRSSARRRRGRDGAPRAGARAARRR